VSLPDPPVRDRVLDDRGFVSQPWRAWLMALVQALRALGA